MFGLLLILAVVGLLALGVSAFSRRGARLGRLPGDISYRGRGTRVFVPLTTMLLLSLLLTLLLNSLGWLF